MTWIYVFFAIFAVSMAYSAWKAVAAKRYRDLIPMVLMVPFFVFCVVSASLGGSAWNEAETNYELYEVGHYYLVSHGTYTEVSYGSYLCVKILEVVGLISWAACFVISLIKHFRADD